MSLIIFYDVKKTSKKFHSQIQINHTIQIFGMIFFVISLQKGIIKIYSNIFICLNKKTF